MGFTRTLGLSLAVLICGGCGESRDNSHGRVVVLGVDGLDYGLVRELMARGRMPNFDRLAKSGHFSALATSAPPQSPVAWSSFMTGLDPGGHGIFDFIHVDPVKMAPYNSMAVAAPGGRPVNVGSWSFPTSGGGVRLLRKGKTFWQMLGEHGFRST